ncbi:MAG: elaA [Bacteroidetes bacterium]|jgi:ElaA protein|nr:elaA [Bacteroidota bacterium]
MEEPTFVTKTFNELDVNELYALLKLRMAVFVVEQSCPYQDLDDKDQLSLHLLGYSNGQLALYARCLPEGISYPGSPAIGRVVIDPAFRANKWGYALMQEAIRVCREHFAAEKITISAQYYLLNFYQKCGFTAVGDVYPEDDIPHIKMILD